MNRIDHICWNCLKQGWKKFRFLKKVLKGFLKLFKVFFYLFVQRLNMKLWPKVNGLSEHHVKNDDKIGESDKSQWKYDYEVYLLNYIIKIKTLKT